MAHQSGVEQMELMAPHKASRSINIRHRRMADGVCTECGNSSPIIGNALCQGCIDRRKLYKQSLRLKYIDSGLCARCGKELLITGKKQCQSCSDKINNYKINTRIGRIAQGLCKSCGKEPYVDGDTRCIKCAQRDIVSHRKLIKYYRENGCCISCGSTLDSSSKSRCNSCLQRNRELGRGLRKQVMDHYGGKCTCCGESQLEKLTIDHMDHDGKQHIKEIVGGYSDRFYRWIIKHNYPENLQCLCWNCNMGKEANGGICPHKSIVDKYYPKRKMEIAAKERRKLKIDVINGYGGKCIICGETEIYFLTIDHINNNGAEERRKIGKSTNVLYRRLRRKGYPKEDYQLLCVNCNCSKALVEQMAR